jgi:hypothetical protein
MTVGDLRALLENLDDEAEVRLATQPSWPLAFHLAGVTTSQELFEREQEVFADEDTSEVVWLVAGDHPSDSPYAPREAWAVAVR